MQTINEVERYNRQKLLWGEEGQSKLNQARVAVVGLGPQGVYTALCLASLGVGNIVLVDGNSTSSEERFLDRKVEGDYRGPGYAPLIGLINKSVSIEGYPINLESRVDQDTLFTSTVIVDTTNSIRSKELSLQYGKEKGIPVLSTSSQWGYTKLMFCNQENNDPAYLMPMFEGKEQDQLMALLACGVITEEVRKLIFNETSDLLKEPVRYRLGNSYHYDFPRGEIPQPDPGIYQKLNLAFLGGGALGCWAAIAASAMGFGRVDVVDYGKFESTNVNRQILAYDGVGELKAPHVAKKIESMSSGRTASTGHNLLILPGLKLERSYDLVFDFVDNLYTRAINTAFAITHNIPMISAGSNPFSARVISQVRDQTRCMDCQYQVYSRGKEEEMIRRASCAANPNPSVVMSNAIAAAMAMLEVYAIFEPEKFGQPFNGEQVYRSGLPKRFGTTPLDSACNCYEQTPPSLEVSEEEVAKFVEANPHALTAGKKEEL